MKRFSDKIPIPLSFVFHPYSLCLTPSYIAKRTSPSCRARRTPRKWCNAAANAATPRWRLRNVNSLAGVVRAHAAAKETGLPLIIGAEITPCDAPPVVLWATDRAAYGRLSRLITRGRARAEKGKCELTWDDLAEHADGLLAGVLSSQTRTPSPRYSGERVGVRGQTAKVGETNSLAPVLRGEGRGEGPNGRGRSHFSAAP